jgi:glycerophosphoryl diester phosphodiesterase
MEFRDKHLLYNIKLPIVGSHSGCYYLLPRNTMESFRFCINDLNMKFIEFDVRSTKDGELILLHDAFLNISTDGFGFNKLTNFNTIKNLDAGYKFTLNGKTYPFRNKGIKIPSLNDFFNEFGHRNDLIYFFDIKEYDIVDKVVKFVEDNQLSNRSILGGISCIVNMKLKKYKNRKWLFSADQSFMTKLVLSYIFGLLDYNTICKQDIIGLEMKKASRWRIYRDMFKKFKLCGGKLIIYGESTNDKNQKNDILNYNIDIILTDNPIEILPIYR